MIHLIEVWQQVSRLGHGDPHLTGLSHRSLDGLVHGVEYGPREVCLGVWQACAIIGAGSFDQGEIALAQQVIH